MSIELDIDGDATVTASFVDEEYGESPHTGRSLRRVEAQFRTGSEAARDDVLAALAAGKVTARMADGPTFKVTSRSHSYQQDSPFTTFTVSLDEVEDLACEAVVLDGSVELAPDKYRERFDHNAVIVELTGTTSGGETETLEALLAHDRPHYFPVVRRGVQEEPLRMRFGRCLYQDNDDGFRRHRVVLVQDTFDEGEEPPFKGFNQPEMGRVLDAVVQLQQTVEALVDGLVAAGTLPPDAAAGIRERSQEVRRSALRQFDRTEDEDHFTLD